MAFGWRLNSTLLAANGGDNRIRHTSLQRCVGREGKNWLTRVQVLLRLSATPQLKYTKLDFRWYMNSTNVKIQRQGSAQSAIRLSQSEIESLRQEASENTRQMRELLRRTEAEMGEPIAETLPIDGLQAGEKLGFNDTQTALARLRDDVIVDDTAKATGAFKPLTKRQHAVLSHAEPKTKGRVIGKLLP